jgi:uncharacterized membrane protein
MEKITILKRAIRIVVGAGTSVIVKQIIENNVEAERTIDKMTVPIASVAIGGAVSNAAGKYTDTLIDDIAKTVNELRNRTEPKTDN